jgi:hypothetical protein
MEDVRRDGNPGVSPASPAAMPAAITTAGVCVR